MNILFLTQFFQPEPMFKGLPFAQALASRGHSVEVVTGFPNYPGGKLYPGYTIRPYRREVLGGITVIRLPLFPSHNTSGLGRAVNYISFAASSFVGAPLLSKKPDMIYVYNLVSLMPAARLLRRLYGCPILLDVQDLWPESVASSGMMKNRIVVQALKRFCAKNYRSADQLTVLSPGFKRHLECLGADRSRVEVVYNWCDEQQAGISETERRRLKKENGMEGRFNVLFAGTMGKVQALETVINAAKLLANQAPDLLFTFLGGGVEVERLKAQAGDLANVQFLPRCTQGKAFLVTSIADVLLVHLKKDKLFSMTIPSKTQAYLYCGKPIAMGVAGDAANLVAEASAGIPFEPEEPSSLAGAILEFRNMPTSQREEMGEKGRQFYLRHLSFACGVARFEELFQRFVGKC